jgi:oligopeptide/dipeptide ABC transporter ATP-binding protein
MLRTILTGAGSPSGEPAPGEEILRIEDLSVEFGSGSARTHAVRGLDLELRAGEILGVAGESGSGKTTVALATIGLLPHGSLVRGSIAYRGSELLGLRERELRAYRGSRVSMIFQETGTALNPVMRIGDQLMLAARSHLGGTRSEIRQTVLSALADVRLTDVDRVMSSYPHEMSGGMCQRIIIAMALSCGARVLLADEPTTALDVSVQEEILQLIRTLVDERQLGVILISHDLAVLAEVCDRLLVMYQGEVVEAGPAVDVLRACAHPYTGALLACLPSLYGSDGPLPELPPAGRDHDVEDGCRFRSRCGFGADICRQAPRLEAVAGDGRRLARCWRTEIVLGRTAAGATRAEGRGCAG